MATLGVRWVKSKTLLVQLSYSTCAHACLEIWTKVHLCRSMLSSLFLAKTSRDSDCTLLFHSDFLSEWNWSFQRNLLHLGLLQPGELLIVAGGTPMSRLYYYLLFERTTTPANNFLLHFGHSFQVHFYFLVAIRMEIVFLSFGVLAFWGFRATVWFFRFYSTSDSWLVPTLAWRASQLVVSAMIAKVLLDFQTYLAGSAWLKFTRLLYIHIALHKHMQYVDSSCSEECVQSNRESAWGQVSRALMSSRPGKLSQSQP